MFNWTLSLSNMFNIKMGFLLAPSVLLAPAIDVYMIPIVTHTMHVSTAKETVRATNPSAAKLSRKSHGQSVILRS